MIYKLSNDSYLLEKAVKKFARGRSFLDIGAGSGIQSETALKSGASFVLAADISPESIKLLKSKKLNAISSDLFENIKDKFDIIAFNPPYLPDDKREPKDSKLSTTGGKKGDELILRFLNQAKKHLAPEGAILLVISSLTPRKRITKLLSSLNLKKTTLEREKLFMETLEVWAIKKSLWPTFGLLDVQDCNSSAD